MNHPDVQERAGWPELWFARFHHYPNHVWRLHGDRAFQESQEDVEVERLVPQSAVTGLVDALEGVQKALGENRQALAEQFAHRALSSFKEEVG